ncbi:U-box domain-containing protein 13-like [Pyrus ussuriensis x Pyrus communis]|uniref:RING-type E3 ubiquitin transferase n=1 Tax=Pyrus ussuriensis x Pyrus communis TaxID=2448454 RepID=A0A5N5F5T1_9ROSA|nr:U-box domain-containing protein 13-like [Pyrus ussuriensis x Pyrus communis]
MEAALVPPLMVSTGFLPTGSLLQSLVQICNEVCSMEKLPVLQGRNISTMVRRIKLLASLFEEIKDSDGPLPPSSILCLTELFSVIRRAKFLIQDCKDGSSLWGLMQTELVSNQFYGLVKELGRALDILPLSLLNVTADIKEQIELLHRQAKRAELFIDLKELQRREELLVLMGSNSEKNRKNKGFIDLVKVRDVLSSIGLRNTVDYEEETSKLEAEAHKQAGSGGLIVVSNINNLISLVSYCKTIIFIDGEIEKPCKEDMKLHCVPSGRFYDHSSSSQSLIPNVPDEFRCPISLDLIRDPVIVASGHTYDRNSIAQWINSGHHTCPKSGQKLIHMALIPNYALRSLIQQWCEENNVPTTESSQSSSSDLARSSSKRELYENAVDHISVVKAAVDAVKLTAEFLVGKLATGSPDIQRQAAYELRLLAKTGMNNRRIIAEAGAIPFLVTLLRCHEPRIQENAVTALLNLSIYNNNKILIMAAGAIDEIVNVLESGNTMEARENAAAAIFSLSMIDDCKVTIGKRPRAIPALVGLLKEGTPAGKKDAAIALFNLALYNANKVSVVFAGAVPLLIELLMDDKAGITDDALALLAQILGCSEGREEIGKSRILENAITLLLGLCKDGGEEVARRLLMNPRSIPSLQSLAADGSLKARRKADTLLRLLNRCCFQSHHQIG